MGEVVDAVLILVLMDNQNTENRREYTKNTYVVLILVLMDNQNTTRTMAKRKKSES